MNAKIKKKLKSNEEIQKAKNESFFYREVLKEVIMDELASLEICDDYEIPNWDYKQAEVNGKRKAYKSLLSLLDLD